MSVELVRGDIARQPGFIAVVNAANAQLMPGGGVAGVVSLDGAEGEARAEDVRVLVDVHVQVPEDQVGRDGRPVEAG